MYEEIKRLIQVLIILLFILIAELIAYYTCADVESQEPETIEIGYNIEKREYQNRQVFVLTPKENKSDKTIIYFHGGAYVAQMTEAHWDFLGKLIHDTKATIIVPDYPLTPKYNYKDVFDMVEPLYTEIVKNVEPQNIIMMGDSAGGGLALALEEKLGEDNLELPYKLILISPWLDVRMENTNIEEVQKYDKDLNKDKLKLAGIAYAGLDGIDNYLVNPIDGPIEKLQNVTIFTGTYDILNPDVHILIERAKIKNINITLKEYETAQHIWIINNINEELVKQGYNDLLSTIND